MAGNGGGGTVNLTASNTYSGNTLISAGTLAVVGGGVLGGGAMRGNIVVSNNAALVYGSMPPKPFRASSTAGP